MKIIGKFYALCLAVVAGVLTVLGQPQPLPIKSHDALREYALGQVVRGFRDVTATSMVRLDNQPTWMEVKGTSAENVLDRLFGTEIIYSIANPLDQIEGRVWLYDKSDNLLFFGSARYTAADLGKVGPSYSIWMQDIPLPLENVQQAEVLVLNADGITVRRQNVRVDRQGHPLFGQYLAGAPNGILSVRFQDGSVMTYELWNPVGEKPTSVTESGPSWKIEGHHVVTASEKPETRIVKIIETWARPTVLLNVTSIGDIIFDVMGIVQDGGVSFERPTSMEVIRLGPDGKTAESGTVVLNTTSPTTLRVDAGQYRIRFNWVKFGQPNTLYDGPVNAEKG